MTDTKRQKLAAFTSKLPPTSRLRAAPTICIPGSKEGRDFSVKMDVTSVPRVESVALLGLDFSMRPENVRFEASKGFIKPLPEQQAMDQIRSLAMLVYDQEKFTAL